MPYLKSGQNATDRLRMPSDSGYWVDMKRHAEYGDQLTAQAAMMKIEANGNGQAIVSDPDTAASVRMLIANLVVDWNLDDENGQKLPITPQIIDKLDPRDGDFLATEANKRVGGRPDEKQIPFGNISGLPSTATPSKTKRLRAS